MSVKTIKELAVDGRRVFLRLDLNVALDSEGSISDETRIQDALPTLQELIEREARIVVCAHLGNPKARREARYSMEPVAARLAHLLDTEIILSEDSVGDGPRKMAFALREGQIMMLENSRFYTGETECDDSFSKQLASFSDIYVDDAFAAMHRKYASIVGVPKYLKEKGMGLLARREVTNLRRLVERPARPFVAVIGGARVKDKIPLLLNLVGGVVDTLCIGGAMALTFLAARGVKMGSSRVELESLALAEKVLRKAEKGRTEIVLPVDHVVTESLEADSPHGVEPSLKIGGKLMAVDIGPETLDQFRARIEKAHTIFWSGPMGVLEIEAFAKGTEQVARAVAAGSAYSVAGGVDSVAALRRMGLGPFISHLSTGGMATLKFLEGVPLPGLAALEED